MTHGELIRTAREKLGLTKSELARRSSVDRGMLVNIEKGELAGSIDTLVKLAKALDIDLNLLKQDGSEPTAAS